MELTISEARLAISHLDTVGKQLNQILGKRAPLLRMMVGRPIKLREETTATNHEALPQ